MWHGPLKLYLQIIEFASKGRAIKENLSDLIEDISAKAPALRDDHAVEPPGSERRFTMPEWAGPACVGLAKQQAPQIT